MDDKAIAAARADIEATGDLLERALKELTKRDPIVVTCDDEGEEDGIPIVSAWKWLLAN